MGKGTRVVRKAIVFDSKDNVATAIVKLEIENSVSLEVDGKTVEVKLKDSIPFGHKFAIRQVKKGDEVIKYGEAIGRATREIRIGEHVHIQNVESKRLIKTGRGD